MSTLVLKIGATLLTVVSAMASAFFVTGHVKNSSAPLQPAVVGVTEQHGKVVLSSSVKSTSVEAVTSTYAS